MPTTDHRIGIGEGSDAVQRRDQDEIRAARQAVRVNRHGRVAA